MKRFLLSATSAAVLSLLSSGAFAVVNLDNGAGASNYAKELVTPGTTALTGAAVNVTSTLGFGVSGGQTRFVRYDLSNAKFAGAVAAGDLAISGAAFANVVVSQGGAAGTTFVIFQVTAAGAGNAQNEGVSFNAGTGGSAGLVIQSAGAPVQMAYSLYADAASAAAGGAAGRLNNNNTAQTVAGLVTGVAFSATVNTSTVDVNSSPTYTHFVGGNVATIGQVSIGAVNQVLVPATGAQVVYADLVGAGTALVLNGDFSAAASPSTNNSGVFLGPDNGACPAAGTAPTPNTPTTAATFITDATPAVAKPLCFSVTTANQVKIAAQSFTVQANIVPATGATTGSLAAIPAGTFIRNGLVLKAAFAETSSVSGISRAVSLTNTSSIDSAYTVRCMVNSQTVVNGIPGIVKANSSTRQSLGTPGLGCPTNGTLRGIEMTFASPPGTVIGSVVSQSLSTGQASFDNMVGNQ
ncbi:MAG TPA: hypothetical protein PKC97_15065 [Burkholderiaceae bacterium]|nr:hypothetical protein [Burkholderiaceae bacterium]